MVRVHSSMVGSGSMPLLYKELELEVLTGLESGGGIPGGFWVRGVQ
jgi:hypothetical protein